MEAVLANIKLKLEHFHTFMDVLGEKNSVLRDQILHDYRKLCNSASSPKYSTAQMQGTVEAKIKFPRSKFTLAFNAVHRLKRRVERFKSAWECLKTA